MEKIGLQRNENTYSGEKTGLYRIFAGLTAIVITGTSFAMSGCGFPRKAEVAAIDTPVATQTENPVVTPTIKPTEVPTPTPNPTQKTVPELTEKEFAREIESLGILSLDQEIPLDEMGFVLYSKTTDEGEKHYYFELVIFYIRKSANRVILARLWDDSYIFEFEKDYDFMEFAPQEVAIVPLFESLEGVKVEFISALSNIDYICNEKGIPYRNPDPSSALAAALNKASLYGTEGIATPFTYREYAEYYIRSLSEENRVTKNDFLGPMKYVAPTPSTELSPTPTATVSPTVFRNGNASI